MSVVQKVSDIVSVEFIKGRVCQACLPCSLMVFRELRKLGYPKPDIKIGMLSYEGEVLTFMHVWLEVNGILIDPTTKITNTFYRGQFDETKLKYHVYGGAVPVTCPDQVAICEVVRNVKENEAYISKYFHDGPQYLKEIRRNVISEILNELS